MTSYAFQLVPHWPHFLHAARPSTQLDLLGKRRPASRRCGTTKLTVENRMQALSCCLEVDRLWGDWKVIEVWYPDSSPNNNTTWVSSSRVNGRVETTSSHMKPSADLKLSRVSHIMLQCSSERDPPQQSHYISFKLIGSNCLWMLIQGLLCNFLSNILSEGLQQESWSPVRTPRQQGTASRRLNSFNLQDNYCN